MNAKQCTCGLLAGMMLVATLAEILQCPEHGLNIQECMTSHIENSQLFISNATGITQQNLPASGTVNDFIVGRV